MTFDSDRARRETPGCQQVTHFNNAGAALMPRPVIDRFREHFDLEVQIGGYEAAVRHRDQIEHVYDAAAMLLGCQRDEIAIIENATRAWDMAFYSITFQPGDRILTAHVEYASNYLAFLQVAQRTGAQIEIIPNDEHGQVSVSALRSMIDERVKLIAITHVPTNGGLVNPAAAIGQIARAANVLYLLDACQSVGQMAINVERIGCDFLSATGRKYLRAPRGTGLLYVQRDILDQLEPPFLDLHAATWTEPGHYKIRDDARRFENWESNVAGKIGLAAALDYALEWGLDAIFARITALADTLRARLSALPGITVRDLGVERCGIVTFTVEGHKSDAIQRVMGEHGINVSVTTASSTLLDMQARGLQDMVRASVHYYNTENEIEQFCNLLETLLC